MNYLDPDDILDFLNKRQGIIDAVCITGGEPLLQEGLLEFLGQVKQLGYKVKIDTNGLYPDRLKEFVESGYVDYVAMDIKNSFEKYALTIGLNDSEELIKTIKKSMNYLLNSDIDYEFRTTVVKEYHNKEDLIELTQKAQTQFLSKYEEFLSNTRKKFNEDKKKIIDDTCNSVENYILRLESKIDDFDEE